MFKNSYQNGLLSIFYSCGTNPLSIWDTHVKNGHIKRVKDSEVNSIVLEISSTNVSTTYITCPRTGELGIKLPFLVIILKNMKRYFSFEVTIMDDAKMRRRFRISNFQSTTKIKPFCTSMPIGLSGGWNQVQFNLSDFTKRAYGTQYIQTIRIQIHANVRLRRIYFSDRLYLEDELPQDYKLYLPLQKKPGKVVKDNQSKEITEMKLQRPPSLITTASVPDKKLDVEKPPSVQKVSPVRSIANLTLAPTEDVIPMEPTESLAKFDEGVTTESTGEATDTKIDEMEEFREGDLVDEEGPPGNDNPVEE